MKIDTRAMVSMTEANQNFSKVANLAQQMGSVLILKNNRPNLVIVPFETIERQYNTLPEKFDDDEFVNLANQVFDMYDETFRKLAE